MTAHLPPEYLPPEARPARIDELQAAIRREWLVFGAIDTALLAILVALFTWLVVTDRLPESVGMPIAVLAGAIPYGAFVVYRIKFRIQPLQQELDELQRLEGTSSGSPR